MSADSKGLLLDYMRRVDVVNRGFRYVFLQSIDLFISTDTLESGYNTDLALKIMDQVIPSPTSTKVQLMVSQCIFRSDPCTPAYLTVAIDCLLWCKRLLFPRKHSGKESVR
jgi:hypothetical protein